MAYSAGSFARDDDSFVIYQAGGVSPFGGVLCSPGSDYTVEVRPDGYSRSTFAGMEVTSPAGFGKAWYLKDSETGDVWSAFLNPVCEKADEYEVRYSPGQVSVYSLNHKIACTLTISTIPNYPCEIWRVKLENRTARGRTVSFTTYLEPSIASALESKYLQRERALVMRRRLDSLEADQTDGAAQDLVMVHASTLVPARFQTERAEFLGEGRTLRNPLHVEIDESAGSDGDTLNTVASLTVDVDLPIEGEAEFGFVFGLASSTERAVELARALGNMHDLNSGVEACRRQWAGLCSTVRVKTPDRAFDALVNTWLPYEAFAAWMSERGKPRVDPSRVADLLKGAHALSATAPGLCRDCLLSFAAGLTILGCYSSDGGLVSLPPRELLWLPIGASAYVAETGDTSVLSQSITLKDGPSLSLREHCDRVIGMNLNAAPRRAGRAGTLLLEKAIKLWMLARGEDGDLGSRLDEVRNRRLSERDDQMEQTIPPRRLRYLQSISHTLADKSVAGDLGAWFAAECDEPGDAAVAAMLYTALVESVLGVTATAEGLTLDPKLPASWHECSIIRRFRSDTYNITVKRSGSPDSPPAIVVDSEPVLGDGLPHFGDGGEHFVEAVVG